MATTNSVPKCSILQTGNTTNGLVFYLDSDILANANVVKDLGILVDGRLSNLSVSKGCLVASGGTAWGLSLIHISEPTRPY